MAEGWAYVNKVSSTFDGRRRLELWEAVQG